jgi:2,5-diamino-6-(ribosylamino)-4(3H)-pyrimidinone 5'-phosphate reductase
MHKAPMRPYLILHNAISLDGRVSGFIPDIARYYALVRIWKEDATLVGSETLIKAAESVPEEKAADFRPRSVRSNDKRPLLVVPDSRGRIRTWHYWRKQPYWKDILVLCTKSTPEKYLAYLEERRVSTQIFGEKKVQFDEVLAWLYSKQKIRKVRVDSGGTLNGVLLRAGLVDEVSLLVHPCLVGGAINQSFFRAANLNQSDGVIALKNMEILKLKNDLVWFRYRVPKNIKRLERVAPKAGPSP